LDLCLTALAQRVSSDAPGITRILADTTALLPDRAKLLPGFSAWQEQCKTIINSIVDTFLHVPSIITQTAKLTSFREQPLTVIKPWASRSDLVVDCEDSVAVLLGWWIRGVEGSKCSQEQLKELAQLLRVKELTTGAMPGAGGWEACL
jgi:hypothetical protein